MKEAAAATAIIPASGGGFPSPSGAALEAPTGPPLAPTLVAVAGAPVQGFTPFNTGGRTRVGRGNWGACVDAA